jgi:hypothetical protein
MPHPAPHTKLVFAGPITARNNTVRRLMFDLELFVLARQRGWPSCFPNNGHVGRDA